MARKDKWWQNALEFALDPKNLLTAAGAATGNPMVAGAGRTIGGMMDAPDFGPEKDARRSSLRSPEGEGFGAGNVMNMAGDFGSGYGMQQIGAGIKGHFQGTPAPAIAPGVVTDVGTGPTVTSDPFAKMGVSPSQISQAAPPPRNAWLDQALYRGEEGGFPAGQQVTANYGDSYASQISQAAPPPTPDPIGFNMNTPGVQESFASTMPTDFTRFKPKTTLENLKDVSVRKQVGDLGNEGGGIKNWLKNMEPMEAYMLAEALSGIMQGAGGMMESRRRDEDRTENSEFIGQFMSGKYSPTRYPGRG